MPQPLHEVDLRYTTKASALTSDDIKSSFLLSEKNSIVFRLIPLYMMNYKEHENLCSKLEKETLIFPQAFNFAFSQTVFDRISTPSNKNATYLFPIFDRILMFYNKNATCRFAICDRIMMLFLFFKRRRKEKRERKNAKSMNKSIEIAAFFDFSCFLLYFR